MRRRVLLCSLAARAGWSGAGVSTDYLRDEVASEVAQVLVNRSQLAPWINPVSVDDTTVDSGIAAVRKRLSAALSGAFEVAQLHDLRRFYSAPDGQAVAALAYSDAGNRPKAALGAEQYGRIEASLQSPVIAESVSVLRGVLRDAFAAELSFGA